MKQWQKWFASCAASLNGVARGLALWAIEVYRLFFSGLVGGICRFQPTCSAYARDAFETHPPLKAMWLVGRRLSRCHPLGPFGFDPVPGREER